MVLRVSFIDRWEETGLDSAVRKRTGGHEFEFTLADPLSAILLCMT